MLTNVVKIAFALPSLPFQGLHHLVAPVWSPPTPSCHRELVRDADCIVIRSSGDLHVTSWLLAWFLTLVHFLLFQKRHRLWRQTPWFQIPAPSLLALGGSGCLQELPLLCFPSETLTVVLLTSQWF